MTIEEIKKKNPDWIYIKTFNKNGETFAHFKNFNKTQKCSCKGLDCDGCYLSDYEEIKLD